MLDIQRHRIVNVKSLTGAVNVDALGALSLKAGGAATVSAGGTIQVNAIATWASASRLRGASGHQATCWDCGRRYRDGAGTVAL